MHIDFHKSSKTSASSKMTNLKPNFETDGDPKNPRAGPMFKMSYVHPKGRLFFAHFLSGPATKVSEKSGTPHLLCT